MRIPILILLLAAGTPPAQGAETASFLKISPGARPLGMGNSFTGIADDLNALAWNPAGIRAMKSPEAAFMHAQLFADMTFDFVGFARPLGTSGQGGTAAVGFSRLTQGSLEGRDASRQATGSFAAADTALQVAYSRNLFSGGPALGLSLKYLKSEIADASASGSSVDLGLMNGARLSGRPVSYGVSVMNLGSKMRFLEQADNLPLTFSMGAGIAVLPPVLLAVDIRHRPYSGKTFFGIGMEYALLSSLTLRTGYAAALASAAGSGSAQSTDPFRGLGMGVGIRISKARLDYAFTPSGELGSAQRISLSTRF